MSKQPYIARISRSYKGADGIERTRWQDIGAAWSTKSGKGFNVTLFALPIDGQFTLFAPSEKAEQSAA